jgi:3-deoxy-D-manno-octulosonate 8-phosphate phosphatase (KDO 8-P phosphatase)
LASGSCNDTAFGWVGFPPGLRLHTEQRARDLKVDFLHQAPGRKSEAVEGILEKAEVAWEQVCFIGDDLVDLGVLRRAGLGVAVANAVPEAKSLAHYVTRAEGGRGAVREVVDLILRAQGHWTKLVEDFAA